MCLQAVNMHKQRLPEQYACTDYADVSADLPAMREATRAQKASEVTTAAWLPPLLAVLPAHQQEHILWSTRPVAKVEFRWEESAGW